LKCIHTGAGAGWAVEFNRQDDVIAVVEKRKIERRKRKRKEANTRHFVVTPSPLS